MTQSLITRIKAFRELAEKANNERDASFNIAHHPFAMIELYDAVLKVLEGR